ncbi:MAG: hypothetical protein NC452_02250 [Eubacterium sp.]|nr:hypothetical protein [Eubacterium sp.]
MANGKFTKLEALEKLAKSASEEIKQVREAIPTVVSELNNDSGYQTADDVSAAIFTQVGKVFRPRGTVLFSELPELSEAVLGDIYDIKEKFTTTADFREGEGKKYPAGTNVAVVQDGDMFKFDVLSGEIDLSGYVEKETGKGLSSNDYTNEAAAKLGGIADGATKVEVSEIAGNVKINGVETPIIGIAADAEVDAVIAKYFPGQAT